MAEIQSCVRIQYTGKETGINFENMVWSLGMILQRERNIYNTPERSVPMSNGFDVSLLSSSVPPTMPESIPCNIPE